MLLSTLGKLVENTVVCRECSGHVLPLMVRADGLCSRDITTLESAYTLKLRWRAAEKSTAVTMGTVIILLSLLGQFT